MGDNLIVYGTTWCPDCKRVKNFLELNRVPYAWVNIEEDDEAMQYVEEVNNGYRSVPTLVFSDGSTMTEPSDGELAEKLNISQQLDDKAVKPHEKFWDLIVIGGGPAGLTAAIYATREGLDTLIIERAGLGGQAAITQTLDNFPGFDMGITGEELAERLELQAERFGTVFRQGEEVVDIYRDGHSVVVRSVNDREYLGRAVIIATGSKYRRLNVPGEEELIGTGVHFCATCDGAFYKGKEVLVVGGGNSGFEEGIHLTRFANKVSIVEFMPDVKASQILREKVYGHDKMEVITNHAIKEFVPADGGGLASVVVEDRATGEVMQWNPDGVFVFIGLEPNTHFLPETIELNKWGFIKTSPTLESSLSGVFAAGDVRAGSTKQAVSAAGEGATAALMVRQYLQALGDIRTNDSIEQEDSYITAGD